MPVSWDIWLLRDGLLEVADGLVRRYCDLELELGRTWTKGRRAVASTLVLEAWAQQGRGEAPFTLMTISDEEDESADVVSDMVGRGKLCV